MDWRCIMNEELKQLIGRNIKTARERKGKTQAELAEYLGMTGAAISAYEKGISVPSLPVIIQIASFLGVSIDWLCGIEKNNEYFSYRDLFVDILKIIHCKSISPHIENEFDLVHSDRYNIKFDDYLVNRFCAELLGIEKLYDSGTFDDDMYKLVIKALLDKPEYNAPLKATTNYVEDNTTP